MKIPQQARQLQIMLNRLMASLISSRLFIRLIRRWRWHSIAGITFGLVIASGFWFTDPSKAYFNSPELDSSQTYSTQLNSIQPTPLILPTALSNNLSDLLSQGQQYYDAGQFSLAVEHWQQAVEQATSLGNLQQQAIAQNYLAIGYQATDNWTAAAAAIAQAKTLLSDQSESFLYAQVLNTEGNLQLQTGHAEAALATWEAAEAAYLRHSATDAWVLNQLNQAHALRVLGHYRQASQKLEAISQKLSSQPDSWLKAQALQSLGITLRAVGDLESSEQILAQALSLAESLPAEASPSLTATEAFRLSLAKTLAVSGQEEQAIILAQQVREKSDRTQTQVEAALLQLKLWQEQNDEAQWQRLLPILKDQLKALPASRWGIYAQVNLAAIALQNMNQSPPLSAQSRPTAEINPNDIKRNADDIEGIANLLAHAIEQARILADPRSESYALGELGHTYEQVRQWADALLLTQQALGLAQQIEATDMIAKWQWQQGRILSHPNNPRKDSEKAIVAYTQAVDELDSIQQDLVAMNPEVQFSFKEQVEPVYRQLVGILLENVEARSPDIKQQRLEKSRQVIESLQLAELQNYFRETCLTYENRSIETIDTHAAVIYPILLSDRIEVIASLPNQPLQHHTAAIDQAKQTKLFQEFYLRLNPIYNPRDSLPPAQQLYDALIRPFESALEQQSIQTLVFVPDGSLRSLPLAALHNGQQYVLEKYRVALTPGMQLLTSRLARSENLSILATGLSEARHGFSPLPAVEKEIAEINLLANGGHSLLNADFTTHNFFQAVETTPANVIHLATHGQFSSSAENTFLITWDNRINVNELSSLFKKQGDSRSSIELLVLSACQTASGDARAALGMAGVAVRSGARSTLATLWAVNDESTAELMIHFYRLLAHPNTSAAEALQQAQIDLLQNPKYNHPYYWAPFVLIGNWL